MEDLTNYDVKKEKVIVISLKDGECDAFVHFLDSIAKESGLRHVEMIAFLKQKYLKND